MIKRTFEKFKKKKFFFNCSIKGILIGHQIDFPTLYWPGFSYGSAFSMLTCAVLFWGVEVWNLGECGKEAGSRPGTVSGRWNRRLDSY